MATELALLTHSQGAINDVNSAFCDRFGYTRSEVIGRNPLDLIPSDWHPIVQRKINSEDESPYYTLGKNKAGLSIPVYLQAKQIRIGPNHTERVVVIREERDLPLSMGSSSSLREEELTRIAHELRTPLTSMLLALRMFKLAASEQKQEQYYQIAMQCCEKELNLVNSTLALKRLNSATCTRKAELIRLGPWLINQVEAFEHSADEQGLKLSLELPEELIVVETDPCLVTRILQELLGNALKYTQSGGQVLVQLIPGESGITLEVHNTATIPSEAIPRLFDRFYRVHRGDRYEQQSSGLGLHLVREMQGKRISNPIDS